VARTEWNHTPKLPLRVNPLFERPFDAMAVVRWYIGAWLPLSVNLVIVGLAVLSYWLFSPALAQAATPGWWMIEVLARNAVLIACLAGGLQALVPGTQAQGVELKYDKPP